MKWTTTTPTTEGYYWSKLNVPSITTTGVVFRLQFIESLNSLCVIFPHPTDVKIYTLDEFLSHVKDEYNNKETTIMWSDEPIKPPQE